MKPAFVRTPGPVPATPPTTFATAKKPHNRAEICYNWGNEIQKCPGGTGHTPRRDTGKVLPMPLKDTTPTCSIEGCNRPFVARGWCATHYARWFRNGDPLLTRRWSRPPTPIVPYMAERMTVKGPDDCWEWNARVGSPDGYGRVMCRPFVNWLAHRVMWTVAYGPIPDGLIVRHKCDNPPCCNPRHLQIGTQRDNVHDAIARGRARYRVKVTDDDVRKIRSLRASGMVYREIAERFGLSEGHVHDIANRKKRRGVV